MRVSDVEQRALTCRRAVLDRVFSRMNERQKEAVFQVKGPLLVLAGAGSGKTTVLVNRIVNLIRFGEAYHSEEFTDTPTLEDLALLEKVSSQELQDECFEDLLSFRDTENAGAAPLMRLPDLLAFRNVKPWEILSITFTNKAAAEMRERLEQVLGEMGQGLWAGTFHSICAKILRRHDGGLPGFDRHFAIYDTDDSRRIMKEIQKVRKIDEKFLPHKQILGAISRAKDRLISPSAYIAEFGNDNRQRMIADCYQVYQHTLHKANAKDFDDIIVHTVQLLEENSDVRALYQRRFRYVLVDEYQDTNHAQYRLISLLSAKHGNLCVVGDDDQSIYRFRGATIENILEFEHQFQQAKVVRLEQNYRSTQTILDAANAVIAHNLSRKGKTLWTGNSAGAAIQCVQAEDERDEARRIVEDIAKQTATGAALSEHAILYRASALSAALENQLVRAGLPYRVIGGTRFYDRKEIRDALAYLTMMVNPSDEVRLRRIINEPKRGIGDTTLTAIAARAEQEACSFFEVLCRAREFPELQRAVPKLHKFLQMLHHCHAASKTLPLKETLELLLNQSGYLAALSEDKEKGEERRENLQELASNLVRYSEETEEPTLAGFLEDVALQSDLDQYNTQSDTVVLMTLHAAKGLEFPSVYLPAWEERIFPGSQAIFSGAQEEIEEERRLAYVGITRARERLWFSTARTRLLYGSTQYNPPSRFLKEAGMEFERTVEQEGHGASLSGVKTWPPERRTTHRSEENITEFSIGETVKHPTFGTGFVLTVTPMGKDQLLEIAFERSGTKKVMGNYAKLTRPES